MTAVDGAAGAVVCLMVEQLTCEMGLVGLGRIFRLIFAMDMLTFGAPWR